MTWAAAGATFGEHDFSPSSSSSSSSEIWFQLSDRSHGVPVLPLKDVFDHFLFHTLSLQDVLALRLTCKGWHWLSQFAIRSFVLWLPRETDETSSSVLLTLLTHRAGKVAPFLSRLMIKAPEGEETTPSDIDEWPDDDDDGGGGDVIEGEQQHDNTGQTVMTEEQPYRVPSSVTSALIANCPNIRHLNLTRCHIPAGPQLQEVLTQWSCLRHLTLCEYGAPDTDRFLAKLGQCARFLREFRISFSPVTDQGLQALAQGTQSLRRIAIKGCNQVSDEGILALVRVNPGLQRLDLVCCCSLTWKTTEYIFRHCPGLARYKKIEMNRVLSKDLDVILEKPRPNLEHLDIGPAVDQPPSTFIPQILRQCPRMRTLANLHHYRGGLSCLELGKNLTTIRLPSVCRRDMEHIAEFCGPQLVTLEVPYSLTVNDGMVPLLCARFPKLQKLNIIETEITLQGLKEMCRQCPNLRRVKFGRWTYSRLGGRRIALIPPREAVIFISTQCPWIRRLDILEAGVTEKTLRRIQQDVSFSNPWLKVCSVLC